MNNKEIIEAYKLVEDYSGDGGTPSSAGAMDSGSILDASLADPKHGIYVLFNPLTKKKKKFANENAMVMFRRTYPDFITKEELCLKKKVVESTTTKQKPFDRNDYDLIPRSKKVSVIIGRFQPYHKGHAMITNAAKYPSIIAIIRNENSDKGKNPFSFDLQKEIIAVAKPNGVIDIIEFESASFPLIIHTLRLKDYEVAEILCGSDREKGYIAQANRYNNALNANVKITTFEREEDKTDIVNFNASKIRDAIKNDDYLTVLKMMVNMNVNLFTKLKAEL